MDIVNQTRAAKLILQLLTPGKTTEPVIPYSPQKPDFPSVASGALLPRATPESRGISSKHISDFLIELASDPTLNMHGITVAKDGAVISEADFGLWRSDIWHTTFSLCKSITSLAVGMLIDDGKLSLDDRVVDLLSAPPLIRLAKGGLTVRHLLTMSGGSMFNEAGSVTDVNWLKGFLESLPRFEAGREFEYNSMNTYVLSCIVREVSGTGLNDFLTERLWKPLGIELHGWEKSPTGIEKGGWGLYLLREDIVKIGMLVASGGVWNGKRLISEEYLAEATRMHMKAPEGFGGYDYGYQIWVGKSTPSFLFNGMFGQNLLCFTESGVILATNAGNSELFQQSSYFRIAEKYFGKGFSAAAPLPEDASALRTLRRTEREMYPDRREKRYGVFSRRRAESDLRRISGRSWTVTSENRHSFGVLPLALQAFRNGYSDGISGITFGVTGTRVDIGFVGANGVQTLRVGTEKAEYSVLEDAGEKYIIGCFGRFGRNEDGVEVLTVETAFCETASGRVMKFFFHPGGRMTVKVTETPGTSCMISALGQLGDMVPMRRLFAAASDIADPEYIAWKLGSVIDPVLVCEENLNKPTKVATEEN